MQRPWPTLCAALALASLVVQALPGGIQARLSWHAGDAWQHPWSLWTSALVHLGWAHLLANLAALVALAFLGQALQAGRAAIVAAVVAWPLVALALPWWPEIRQYSGLSGLIHALTAVLWAQAAINSGVKPVAWLLFSGLALKAMSEHGWSRPMAFDLSWGFNVAYAAHFAGIVAGSVLGWALIGIGALGRIRTR